MRLRGERGPISGVPILLRFRPATEVFVNGPCSFPQVSAGTGDYDLLRPPTSLSRCHQARGQRTADSESGRRLWSRRMGIERVLTRSLFRLPNKRLKLTGGDRSKGSGVLCPGGVRTSSHTLAPAYGSPAA